MRALAASLLPALLAASPVLAQERRDIPPPEPPRLVEDRNWIAIDPDYLLVMDLAPAADGSERRVVIQLMEPPLARGWTANIQRLARGGYWEGSSINRVQDNFVVQWGQPDEGTLGTYKPLPGGLSTVPASEYTFGDLLHVQDPDGNPRFNENLGARMMQNAMLAAQGEVIMPQGMGEKDFDPGIIALRDLGDRYAPFTTWARGWPIAGSLGGDDGNDFWPVHCYGMVGVGRGLSPDTGSGAQLYTIIAHAPRQLDRNVALVGRVIEGMEHLSTLPRGKGPGGTYETEEQLVPIRFARLASDMPDAPQYEFLSTESFAFGNIVRDRAVPKSAFYNVQVGAVDVCNVQVPVRRAKG